MASVGFIKYNASTTRINKEKNFKIKFQVILVFYRTSLYFDKTLCHKVFSDITSFFEEIFSQSKNFYENNDIMVLSDTAKSGLGSAWCMDWWILSFYHTGIAQTWALRQIRFREQRQTITITKIRLCYFFRAVYHSKNHVIPYCFIAGILNILQRWKTTIAH